jgi:hypothetical protein
MLERLPPPITTTEAIDASRLDFLLSQLGKQRPDDSDIVDAEIVEDEPESGPEPLEIIDITETEPLAITAPPAPDTSPARPPQFIPYPGDKSQRPSSTRSSVIPAAEVTMTDANHVNTPTIVSHPVETSEPPATANKPVETQIPDERTATGDSGGVQPGGDGPEPVTPVPSDPRGESWPDGPDRFGLIATKFKPGERVRVGSGEQDWEITEIDPETGEVTLRGPRLNPDDPNDNRYETRVIDSRVLAGSNFDRLKGDL